MKKILVGTDKPFAASAVEKIKKIAVDAGYEFCLLEKYKSQAELMEAVADVEALIVRSDLVTPEVIEAGKKLEIVVRAGAGYDNIDLKAATAKNVVVMNTPGQNANAVAELAMGMMVFMARNKYDGNSGTELRGKKLGLHAFGNVGKMVGQIAKGFGMEVFAFDPFVDKIIIENAGVKALDSVEELYTTCQYVALQLPYVKDTKAAINYSLLSLMPKKGVLVNTARKEIINEEDLLKIMEERQDFVYISDIEPDSKAVFAEKYPTRHFFTPKKMGAQTSEANNNAGIAAVKQIINFFEKGDKTFQVNK